MGFSRKDLVLLVSGALISGAIGWMISSHFHERAKGDEISEARQLGFEEGRIEGITQAEADFEKARPQLLSERYETELMNARQAGEAEGYRNGFADGRQEEREVLGPRKYDEGYNDGYTAGYSAGENDGYSRGVTDGQIANSNIVEQMQDAAENWEIFAERLIDLESAARAYFQSRSGENRDNLSDEQKAQIRNELISEVRAVTAAAQTLRESFSRQSEAFNSLIDDMREALTSSDLDTIGELALAVSKTSEIRRRAFLTGRQTELETFESLGN